MKILVIDFENYNNPQTADSRRMSKLVKHLSKSHEIHNVFNPWISPIVTELPPNSHLFSNAHEVSSDRMKEISEECIKLYQEDQLYNPDFHAEKEFIVHMENKFAPVNFIDYTLGIVHQIQPEVVLFKYSFFRRVAHFIPKHIKVWYDNPISQYSKTIINASCSFFKDVGCSKEQEKRLLIRGDLVTFNHKREADYFIDPNRETTFFLSDQSVTTNTSHPEIPTILFVGNNSGMNNDYINAFVRHCFPLVQKEIPEVVLRISGTTGHSVASNSSIIKELNPIFPQEYDNATVIINPVRPGAGFKTKVAEGIASKKAVVTFKEGFEHHVPYGLLYLCDNWVDMASNIVYAINNKDTHDTFLAESFCRTFMSVDTAYKNIDKYLETL